MLLDATAVLLGVGLAVAGFIVVVVVSATVLRLIGFVLGDGEASVADDEPDEDESTAVEGATGAGADETPGPGDPA